MKVTERSPVWEIVESQNWEVNGISLGYSLSRFTGHNIHRASNDKDRVRFHFGLKGDYRFTYRQLDQSFDLAGGHHNIMYSKGIDLEFYNKTNVIETFGIDFPKHLFIEFTRDADDLLKKFNDDILAGKNALLSEKWGTIDINIQKIIDDIKFNPYTGRLKNIFLLAKTLELLVVCVDNYHQISKTTWQHLKTRSDREKIIAARDFINDRITDPPSLTEVSKTVGLNEFKLKAGFREMFQNTLFGYLTERRLHLASQYLQNTEDTVAEIAHRMGYSSPQHFHTQFKKHVGLTPNEWRNR